MIYITECPRDAMQGMEEFVPTATKISYLNTLLKVGFQRLDCGSFVSPKAIPQMADTASVLEGLDLTGKATELLVIVANKKGAEQAVLQEKVTYLGYPFSVSETFQLRNTNATIEESFLRVQELVELCTTHHKKLVVYLSMAFGNPYGDEWSEEIVLRIASKLVAMGVQELALSDTTGMGNEASIAQLYTALAVQFPSIIVGLHLHSNPQQAVAKIKAAVAAGCTHFDVAMKGFGGCPMATDKLTGNIATEQFLQVLKQQNYQTTIQQECFLEALVDASGIFIRH